MHLYPVYTCTHTNRYPHRNTAIYLKWNSSSSILYFLLMDLAAARHANILVRIVLTEPPGGCPWSPFFSPPSFSSLLLGYSLSPAIHLTAASHCLTWPVSLDLQSLLKPKLPLFWVHPLSYGAQPWLATPTSRPCISKSSEISIPSWG